MKNSNKLTHTFLSFFFKYRITKWCLPLVLFIPLIFSAKISKASHMMGADITCRLEKTKTSCTTTFVLDTLESQNSLSEQIISQWMNKNDAPICLTNNKGKRVAFTLVISYQNGSASMFSSTGGVISRKMMKKILTLKRGNTILIEQLYGMNPYDQNRKRYPSVCFKLE